MNAGPDRRGGNDGERCRQREVITQRFDPGRADEGGQRGEPDRRYVKADAHALAIRCAPSSGYKWSVPVNPAGLAKHYFEPALAALGFDHVRWHDLRHAFAVMSLTAGEHYMAVSKMLGHASYVTTLTVYADYITEGDGGKAAPLRRPVPTSVTNVVPMRRQR